MKNTENIYALIPLFFASCLSAHASTLSFSNLPGEIQDCLQAGTCGVSASSTTDFGNVSFFDYQSYSAEEGVESKQLISYSLTPPSAKSHDLTSYDGESNDYASSTLDGTVWLVANKVYDLADSRHTFTLYLDAVTPGADNLWGWDEHPLKKIISISTSDLLGGGSSYALDYLDNYAEQGGLKLHAAEGDAGYPYLTCIECSAAIDFNLIGLRYVEVGPSVWLVTNPLDSRALLYSESSYQYEGLYTGSRQQTFYVAAVPEPETWGMLLAGLGLVGAAAGRRRICAAV